MRGLLVLLIMLLALGGAVAATEKKSEEKSRSGSGAEKAETAEPSRQSTTRKEPAPQWPRPYRPSEEVSVDSIVPFPVDI